MAASVTTGFSFPSSNKSTSLPRKTSIISPKRITFKKFNTAHYRYKHGSAGGRVPGSINVRAQDTTSEAPAYDTEMRESKKFLDESVALNRFTPSDPFIARCLSNTTITGHDAPAEIHHIVLSTQGTQGDFAYIEGQILGVIPDDVDKNGNPYPPSLYTIASSALGDFGDSKTVSLCVKRVPKGVCSNFLCDLQPGELVTITGPYGGGNMLMPRDPNATILMLATDTGIARFRSFSRKMFIDKNNDYKFNGLAWLFFGVPTTSSLLYKEEFDRMKLNAPLNLKLDFAIGDQNEYIEKEMAKYPEFIWNFITKDNTFVYVCGLEGMVPGIDNLMESLAETAGIHWVDYKRQLKQEGRWNVEVY